MILDILKDLYAARFDEVEAWLSHARAGGEPYLTTSVDLRHSGLRLAPVDTNLYPAGFNNLSANGAKRAAARLRAYFSEALPFVRRVAIVPENHTRNMGYLENLATLQAIFAAAGLEVRFASLAAAPGEPLTLHAPSGLEIRQEPVVRGPDNRLVLENGFAPDAIVLNNDFSAGPSALLEGIVQPVLPPMDMGWHTRKKSAHFAAYARLAQDFAEAFGLDPWLICASFHACGALDFKERQGVDALARAVDGILAAARLKHAQYGINHDPYVYVKADSGTYGMGIMHVRDGSELLEMNKKERNKMHVIKEGARVSDVIVQEGIPTVDEIDGKHAEPMMYLIDGVPVGGMFRVNGARDAYGNLNAAGMEFTGMCDEAEAGSYRPPCKGAPKTPVEDCHFRAYGLIAALAALAAGREAYGEAQPKRAAMGASA